MLLSWASIFENATVSVLDCQDHLHVSVVVFRTTLKQILSNHWEDLPALAYDSLVFAISGWQSSCMIHIPLSFSSKGVALWLFSSIFPVPCAKVSCVARRAAMVMHVCIADFKAQCKQGTSHVSYTFKTAWIRNMRERNDLCSSWQWSCQYHHCKD